MNHQSNRSVRACFLGPRYYLCSPIIPDREREREGGEGRNLYRRLDKSTLPSLACHSLRHVVGSAERIPKGEE